jgi:heterotetrameric sarcosine oxidase delta subunit
MGFRIDCPNCGSRSYHEFVFGGEVRKQGPQPSDDEDYRRTWLRANVAGVEQELWYHAAGCKRWLEITRDTRTNGIVTEKQERETDS